MIKRLTSRNEQGFALATVMATSTILIMLAGAAVSYGVGSQHISRHDQDWNGALSAAEAGIDDYIFRLNENSNYWVYDAVTTPPDGNLAFKSWVSVAGGASPAQYRYDRDKGTLTTNGVIKLTSTGRVNGTERTVYATLRRRSFIDYLYFTDYETKDPALYTGSPFTSQNAQTYCSKHYYGGSGLQRDVDARVDYPGDSDANSSFCTDINFVTGDSIKGPLHSNDAILVCGTPSFTGETSTSWDDPAKKRFRANSTCGGNNPTFANAGDPKLLAPLTLPPSNSSIKAETLPGRGGCLYTGPTRIKLNTNGTMTVKSPFSKQTNNAPCPTNGTGALPSNGVIFVQTVPAGSTDPNYTNGCPYNVSGNAHPLGLPIPNDKATYKCTYGDAFVEGTLSGQLTIAAENNVDVTWNLTYKGGVGGTDLLGLVANNYLEVYHPVSCTSGYSGCDLNANFPTETPRNAKFLNPTIQAAMLSVNHSFWVQRYDIGQASQLGTLHIDGAIAQRYRGPVGQTGSNPTGYLKQYVYDQRLKYLSPPKFLDPVASSWGVATWAEIKVPAAYK